MVDRTRAAFLGWLLTLSAVACGGDPGEGTTGGGGGAGGGAGCTMMLSGDFTGTFTCMTIAAKKSTEPNSRIGGTSIMAGAGISVGWGVETMGDPAVRAYALADLARGSGIITAPGGVSYELRYRDGSRPDAGAIESFSITSATPLLEMPDGKSWTVHGSVRARYAQRGGAGQVVLSISF